MTSLDDFDWARFWLALGTLALIFLMAAAFLWWCATVWAGGPADPSQYANQMQQQYIGDVVQTVKEQAIPKGELLKQLLLSLAEEVGYGKALIWLATLPVLMLAGTVFGVWKFIHRGSK